MSEIDAVTAAKMHRITNAFHGFVYFAPEATAQYNAIGLDEDAHYFAPRAAPMGAVPAEVVIATFYNFAPRAVRAALPAAWHTNDPAQIQQARFDAVAERFATSASDVVNTQQVNRGIELAQQAVDQLDWSARPLAGANASLDLPDDPIVRLWQLVTVLREWRGDAHIAALAAEGIGPVECLVAHAATGEVPTEVLRESRAWTQDEWEAGVQSLVGRGWCHPDGSFTESGRDGRAHIEAQTDRRSIRSWKPIGQEGAQELRAILKPLSAAVWTDMPQPKWTKRAPDA